MRSCDACPRKHYARGLCHAHYQAYRRANGGRVPQRPVDPVLIDRVVEDRVPARLVREEALAATERLTRAGASATEISRLLKVAPRSVTRYRAKLRAA